MIAKDSNAVGSFPQDLWCRAVWLGVQSTHLEFMAHSGPFGGNGGSLAHDNCQAQHQVDFELPPLFSQPFRIGH